MEYHWTTKVGQKTFFIFSFFKVLAGLRRLTRFPGQKKLSRWTTDIIYALRIVLMDSHNSKSASNLRKRDGTSWGTRIEAGWFHAVSFCLLKNGSHFWFPSGPPHYKGLSLLNLSDLVLVVLVLVRYRDDRGMGVPQRGFPITHTQEENIS
jgi:hypothetical protein